MKLLQLKNKYEAKPVIVKKVLTDLHFEKLTSDLEKAFSVRSSLNYPFLKKEEITFIKYSLNSYCPENDNNFRTEGYKGEIENLKLRNENFISDALKSLFKWLRSLFGDTASSITKAAEPTPKKPKENTAKTEEEKKKLAAELKTLAFLRHASKKYFPVKNFRELSGSLLTRAASVDIAIKKFNFFLALFDHVSTSKKYTKTDFKAEILRGLSEGCETIKVNQLLPTDVLPDKWGRLDGCVLSFGWSENWNSHAENFLFYIPYSHAEVKTFQEKKIIGEKRADLETIENKFELEIDQSKEVKHTLEMFDHLIEKLKKLRIVNEAFDTKIDMLEKLAGSANTEEEGSLENNVAHFCCLILKDFINYFRNISEVILCLKKDKEANEEIWEHFLKV